MAFDIKKPYTFELTFAQYNIIRDALESDARANTQAADGCDEEVALDFLAAAEEELATSATLYKQFVSMNK